MSEQAVFEALKYRIEVDKRGTRRYCNNANELHRTDGPAVVFINGCMEWWQNDQYHRTDGPAIVSPGGYKARFINGNPLTEDEFNQAVKLL